MNGQTSLVKNHLRQVVDSFTLLCLRKNGGFLVLSEQGKGMSIHVVLLQNPIVVLLLLCRDAQF